MQLPGKILTSAAVKLESPAYNHRLIEAVYRIYASVNWPPLNGPTLHQINILNLR